MLKISWLFANDVECWAVVLLINLLRGPGVLANRVNLLIVEYAFLFVCEEIALGL